MIQTLKTSLLTPFGVRIDHDLAEGLTEAEQAELQQLYAAHYALVFEGQDLSREAHNRVCAYLGPLLDNEKDPGAGGAFISNDDAKGILGSLAAAWHQDLAFAPEPFLGASLLAVDVPAGETTTRFANGALAYARLPVALKERIAELQVVNAWPTYSDRRNRAADIPPEAVRSVHPIVQRHAVTGIPYLFICENQSIEIEGLTIEAAEELIDELFSYVYAPECVLEHSWRNGDLIIWDNLVLQHSRPDISQVGTRTLQRVTIGTKGMFAQYPELWEAANSYERQVVDPLTRSDN